MPNRENAVDGCWRTVIAMRGDIGKPPSSIEISCAGSLLRAIFSSASPIVWTRTASPISRCPCEKAPAEAKSAMEPWILLGALYARSEKAEAAVDALRRATEIAPENPRAWRNLGLLYRRQGLVEFADRCLARAAELAAKSGTGGPETTGPQQGRAASDGSSGFTDTLAHTARKGRGRDLYGSDDILAMEGKMPVKAMDLFDAYSKNALPKDHGYIVSSFFAPNTAYSRYEIVSYTNVKSIYPNEEGLTFQTDGKKLYVLVEPSNYPNKGMEPFVRSSIEKIPLRFSELELFTCKNQDKNLLG